MMSLSEVHGEAHSRKPWREREPFLRVSHRWSISEFRMLLSGVQAHWRASGLCRPGCFCFFTYLSLFFQMQGLCAKVAQSCFLLGSKSCFQAVAWPYAVAEQRSAQEGQHTRNFRQTAPRMPTMEAADGKSVPELPCLVGGSRAGSGKRSKRHRIPMTN